MVDLSAIVLAGTRCELASTSFLFLYLRMFHLMHLHKERHIPAPHRANHSGSFITAEKRHFEHKRTSLSLMEFQENTLMCS